MQSFFFCTFFYFNANNCIENDKIFVYKNNCETQDLALHMDLSVLTCVCV